MINKYKEINAQIKALEISKNDRIKALLISILASILILSGPIVLVVNLFIFKSYLKLLSFILATFIFLIFYLSEYFYLNTICDKKIKGKYIKYIIDLAIPSVIIYLTWIILLIKGVI